jgi:periplasmic protein TonB
MAIVNDILKLSGAAPKNGNNGGHTAETMPFVAALPTRNSEPKKSEASTQKAQETFVAAMLEEPTEQRKRRNPLEWLLSVGVHLAVVAALIIIPLYFTQTLNVKAFQTTWLEAPPPPAPPAPPPPPAAVVRSVRSAPRLIETGKLTAPTVIPKRVAILKEAPPRLDTGAEGIVGGVAGGVAGGQVGGVLGGIIGGTGPATAAVPPPPPPAVKRIVRIGGNLKPPKQIYYEAPVYPVIAKQAQVQGTVVIEAVIDEHGNVVQAQAVSGPPLLIPAALQTVLKWKYEPTYLNGQPVSVQMHVQVNFVL